MTSHERAEKLDKEYVAYEMPEDRVACLERALDEAEKRAMEAGINAGYKQGKLEGQREDRVLAERDAYREVAISNHGHWEVCPGSLHKCNCEMEIPKEVDAEAARLMENQDEKISKR